MSTRNPHVHMRYLAETYRKYTLFLTQKQRAQAITQYAIDKGYVSERPALLGTTFASYCDPNSKQKVHWWVLKSCLDMLMLEQWHPKSPKGWTAFTYCWLKQHGPFKDTEEVLASLPGHIDRSLAKDNFEKVKDRYPISERTKPVSRVQDFNGIPQTTWFTNSESLKETFCDAHGYQNWSDAAEEGYLVKTQHVLASDVSALTSQKDIDYCEA